MRKIEDVINEYEACSKQIVDSTYGSPDYEAAEQHAQTLLLEMHNRLGNEHLPVLTRISKVVNAQELLMPLAALLATLKTQESFDLVLAMFNDCFEDGCEEFNTAQACVDAMVVLDPERVEREGIYDHYMYNM